MRLLALHFPPCVHTVTDTEFSDTAGAFYFIIVSNHDVHSVDFALPKLKSEVPPGRAEARSSSR